MASARSHHDEEAILETMRRRIREAVEPLIAASPVRISRDELTMRLSHAIDADEVREILREEFGEGEDTEEMRERAACAVIAARKDALPADPLFMPSSPGCLSEFMAPYVKGCGCLVVLGLLTAGAGAAADFLGFDRQLVYNAVFVLVVVAVLVSAWSRSGSHGGGDWEPPRGP